MNSRSTMRQVAAHAHVSLKTVSRVINAESFVSPALRSRVQASVDHLGYRRNLQASSLRRTDSRSATIGLVLRDVANALSSPLSHEIESIALKRGVLVFTGSSNDDEDHDRDLIRAFSCHRVDGLIVVGTTQNTDLLLTEHRAGTSIVCVDQLGSTFDSDHVVTNDFEGTRLGIRHLIANGHRHIAYLGGLASDRTARRYRGYVHELSAQGWPIDERLVHLDVHDSDAAEKAAAELLSEARRPTALFASESLITLGACRVLRRLHLNRQVALVGFDDLLDADLMARGVTVITPDPVALGRAAAKLLFRRIDGDESPPVHRLIPSRLITRATSEIHVMGLGRPAVQRIAL
ncbi:MAG: LacI family transcriptional regulator [Chloroflexi bacterium]|nr:MAG: LacI family transcriptional regulator [Chloroflexota bacterium]